jgi:hypothetical protein
MITKLACRVLAASVLAVCVGCESSNECGSGCDPCNSPCQPCATTAAAPAGGSAAAIRDRLTGKPSLTGSEKLMLGDALVELGQYNAAETNYFGALSRGGLSADESFRAQMGLAKCADVQNQNYSARARYQQAWKVAPTDADKDRALLKLAAVEIEDGDLVSARKHRQAIVGSYGELAEIDRKLDAERPAAARGETASAGPRRPAGRGIAPPKMNSRDTWNARPISQRGDPEPMGKPTRMTLHHTADARAVGSSYAAVAERVKAYQTGHQQTNRWADIGYHFIVDAQGRIWQGREMTWKGAHAGNKEANEKNIGIALIGNFEKGHPSSAQKDATEELITWLSLEYGIPSSKIYGHGEIEKMYSIPGTCCPGKNFAPTLAGIKRAVDKAQRTGVVARAAD